MDRLIASVSLMMPEIGGMEVADFNRVLSEFEKLLATLDDFFAYHYAALKGGQFHLDDDETSASGADIE
ncbi:hypothetical protein HGP16_33010 [Rhizobium sp. P40RR-XXII]|nr:hypothetical protein [Rhizobium sp. P28RR-XV]NLS21317.1 hypothetical protein [Rhizobium sp. P40RR-XXII]